MSFSAELLQQADHLATKEPKKPKQASLRRATSNAYYALFHFLTWETASVVAPYVSQEIRMQIQRWFDHTAMNNTCAVFSAATFEGQLVKLAGSAPLPELQLVARTFRQLQQERHSADYDLSDHWTRFRAKENIQNSRSAINAWVRVRKHPQTNIFALAFLDLKKLQTERR